MSGESCTASATSQHGCRSLKTSESRPGESVPPGELPHALKHPSFKAGTHPRCSASTRAGAALHSSSAPRWGLGSTLQPPRPGRSPQAGNSHCHSFNGARADVISWPMPSPGMVALSDWFSCAAPANRKKVARYACITSPSSCALGPGLPRRTAPFAQACSAHRHWCQKATSTQRDSSPDNCQGQLPPH